MTENQIKQLIKDEMNNNSYSGSPIVPRHNHDGVNSPEINQNNVISGTKFNGSIEFDEAKTYTIQINGNPNSITFYGAAKGDQIGDIFNYRSIIIGNAQIGNCYQFQPLTTSSTTLNSTKTPWIQGCSTLTYDTGLATAFNTVSQEHLIAVNYPANITADIKVAAGITRVTNREIDITFSNLSSGWTVTGLIIVT